MEKVLLRTNLHSFRSEGGALVFSHGDTEIRLPYADVLSLKAESNMSAKSGAYAKIVLETDTQSLILDSGNKQFFDVLFDMLCIELDVDMVELFNISTAESKTEKVIYTKKTEE